MKFFVTLLILIICSPVFANVQIGKIEDLKGRVSIYHENSFRGQKANKDDEVFLHDLVRTKTKSFATFNLLKNSKVTVFERSTIIFKSIDSNYENNTQINSGKVLFEINSSDLKSEFKIDTPSAVAGVKGTKFFIEVIDGFTFVTVLEGTVEVISKGEKFLIGKGKRIMLLNKKKFFKPKNLAKLKNKNNKNILKFINKNNLKPILVDTLKTNVNINIHIPE